MVNPNFQHKINHKLKHLVLLVIRIKMVKKMDLEYKYGEMVVNIKVIL